MNRLVAIVLLLCTPAYAQVVVTAGEPSPISGVVLTAEEVATILAEKKAAQERCKVEIKDAQEREINSCTLEKTILKNQIDFDKKRIQELIKLNDVQTKEITNAASRNGDGLVYFSGGLLVGGVVVIALGAGIAYVYTQGVK